MSGHYPVGIVGEASYQSAIRRCEEGECVRIVHEPDNPYDDLALAVVSGDGSTLGYIARDCWLQEAVHEEGKGCAAIIKEISPAGAGKLGVVLSVSLCSADLETRAYDPAHAMQKSPPKGCLASFFG